MIREATPDDIPRLVAMVERFVRESSYQRYITVDPERLAVLMATLIAGDQGVVFVEDRDGDVVGTIGLVAHEHPMSGDSLVSEMFWWVEPEARGYGVRLLKRAERWAGALGAVKIQMVAPTPDVAQIYERLGYLRLETAYQRSL